MARCYRKASGGIFEDFDNVVPCPNQVASTDGHYGCCAVGSACLADGICYQSRQLAGSSGFYTQGCTDSTYADPRCRQSCVSYGVSDVVYNGTTDQWACCGPADDDGHPSCGRPTNETFSASPILSLLQRYDGIAADSSTPSASTGTTRQSQVATGTGISATNSAAVSSADSARVSMDNAAVIGLGVAFGVVTILLCLAVCRLIIMSKRLRSMKRQDNFKQEKSLRDGANDHMMAQVTTEDPSPVLLPDSPFEVEVANLSPKKVWLQRPRQDDIYELENARLGT